MAFLPSDNPFVDPAQELIRRILGGARQQVPGGQVEASGLTSFAPAGPGGGPVMAPFATGVPFIFTGGTPAKRGRGADIAEALTALSGLFTNLQTSAAAGQGQGQGQQGQQGQGPAPSLEELIKLIPGLQLRV